MSKQTATERLRELLDERGVECGWANEYDDQTWWKDRDGNVYFAKGEDFLMYFNLTPEQAIAATLGNDEIDELKDDYCTLIRENKQLQAKVIAQSDHINKLRGEYKVLDEQMERRCAEYRATIRKLKAELDAATLGNDGVERTKNGVAERTTTRNTKRTVYGNPRPVCEVCGYGIGDKRWGYCPKCGARIVDE